MMADQPSGPHAGQIVLTSGQALTEARQAVIMIHGRGASAEDILGLSTAFEAESTCFLAPQAANHTWYPQRFLLPVEQNEPWLSSALSVIAGLQTQVVAAGLRTENLFLLGFSQGACLALEYAARHAQRFGGVFGLSGSLIGQPGSARNYPGNLNGTPVFLGCSDVDPHIPKGSVLESAQVLEALGAQVTLRFYPGFGHSVNGDEIAFVQGVLSR